MTIDYGYEFRTTIDETVENCLDVTGQGRYIAVFSEGSQQIVTGRAVPNELYAPWDFTVAAGTTGVSYVGLAASMGDFEHLDRRRQPAARIRQLIWALRSWRMLSYGVRLSHRLGGIVDSMAEEMDDWVANSPKSLQNMLVFLSSVPELKYPTVTVTPSATFRAEWSGPSNENLAVDFLPDGFVKFVVIREDPLRYGRVEAVSGIVSREGLMDRVEPYKVRAWAADDRPQVSYTLLACNAWTQDTR